MATAEDIAIANKALALIGANAIVAFSDSSTEGEFINAIYEDLARAALGSARWSFAKAYVELTRNGTAPVTEEWDAAYDLPAQDVLIVHRLLSDGVKIPFEVYDDGYYCNAASTATVHLVYGGRVATSAWPALFELAFQHELTALCAGGIAEDETKSKIFGDLAEATYRRARKVYAQGQTNKKFDTGRFINARRS